MEQKYVERNIALAEALESGEYKQATGALRTADGFCCLGVACDVYKKATKKGKWTKNLEFAVKDEVEAGTVPIIVMDWYGWDECNPELLVVKEETLASYHNDDKRRTFKQISKGFRRLAKELAKKAA